MHQRGNWSFSNTATFVQNFRQPFPEATIRATNYSMICDFEIARRIIKQVPGLQAFIRAEPIWNFHSHNRLGLAGQDFRLFYGIRMSLGKPPLTAALQQIREQLEEQETSPPAPPPPTSEPRPAAFIAPYEIIANQPQPIHGFLKEISTEINPTVVQPIHQVLNQKPLLSLQATEPLVLVSLHGLDIHSPSIPKPTKSKLVAQSNSPKHSKSNLVDRHNLIAQTIPTAKAAIHQALDISSEAEIPMILMVPSSGSP
jgi:hypothetical protein